MILSRKSNFGEFDRKEYERWKDRPLSERYANATPLSYEGLRAHEETHVEQFESIEDEITKELTARFSKEVCFATKGEADIKKKELDAFYVDKAIAIKAFEKKYKSGPKSLGELLATQEEWKVYEEQYNSQ